MCYLMCRKVLKEIFIGTKLPDNGLDAVREAKLLSKVRCCSLHNSVQFLVDFSVKESPFLWKSFFAMKLVAALSCLLHST